MTTTNRSKIYIIDDEANILSSLTRLLRRENYDVQTTSDAEVLFEAIKKDPHALVISDQRMPKLEGVEVLKRVKEISPETVTIMLTGYADMQSAIRAVNEGKIYRFLTKPWKEEELRAAIHEAISRYELVQENKRLQALTEAQNKELTELNRDLEKRVKQRTKEVVALNTALEKSFLESVKVMGSLSELANIEFGGHAKRVAKVSGIIAKAMNMTDRQIFDTQVAAFLHDVGKIGIPEGAQATVVAEHAARGANIVRMVPSLESVARIVRHHHENFDGTGYPDRLTSNQIPLGSRIIRAVDAYDKLLYARIGSEHHTPQKALRALVSEQGKQLDPMVLKALAHFVEQEMKQHPDKYEIEIDLYQLRVGMVLSKPLRTVKGRTMLDAEYKIDPEILERIWKRHLEEPFVNEVYVYRASTTAKKAA